MTRDIRYAEARALQGHRAGFASRVVADAIDLGVAWLLGLAALLAAGVVRYLLTGPPLRRAGDLKRHVLLCSMNRPNDWPAWLAAAKATHIDGNAGRTAELFQLGMPPDVSIGMRQQVTRGKSFDERLLVRMNAFGIQLSG